MPKLVPEISNGASATEGKQNRVKDVRVIDYTYVIFLALIFILNVFLVYIASINSNNHKIYLSVTIIIYTYFISTKLNGFKIDNSDYKIKYYIFGVSTSIELQEITDANCETIKGAPLLLDFPFQLMGGSLNWKQYAVNLSGTFGSRQIKFQSKRWRDQFLGALQESCPDVRITRWI